VGPTPALFFIYFKNDPIMGIKPQRKHQGVKIIATLKDKINLKRAIEKAAERLSQELEDLSLELVDTEVLFSSGRLVARLTIDKLACAAPNESQSTDDSETIDEGESADEGESTDEGELTVNAGNIEKAAGRICSQGSQVTIDDCAAFSSKLSVILDELFPEEGPEYILEVSSPGLDRPIRSETDFERFNGRLAKIKLNINGQTARHTGRLLTASKPYRLSTQKSEISFGLDMVVSARLEPEL
jgi:ribosome maturation factor RimP